MSSKAPKFKSVKFTGMKTNRKLFNVEITNSRPTPHYKPRFYTNKNLFFVKNCRKYNSNKNKKRLKINFIKNQKKLLARRELRNKRCLFITQHFKQTTNLIIKKENQSPKPIIKFKKRLKFKISTSKEKIKPIISINENNNTCKQKSNNENTNPIISQFRPITQIQNNNLNITFSEEDNFFSLSNNNTSIKQNNQDNSKVSIGRWHLGEHKRFLEAIIKFGNDWKKVEKYIGTRTSSQARSHAQKFFIKLKEEQKKLKISNDIDYSNSTIKSFHDALQSMSAEKKENIIKELENVIFDSQIGIKKRRKKSKNNCYSESCTDGFISGTDFFEEYNTLLEEGKKNENRKMSVESIKEEKKDKRKFIDQKNEMFTDEEYEKSFHKIFVEKEGLKNDIENRKLSIEDDFMFNINI